MTQNPPAPSPTTFPLPPVTLSLEARFLRASPLNPADRSQTNLSELKTSILEQGVLSSLTVRPHPTDSELYEVVCGECRLRAVSELIAEGKLPVDTELPVILRELSNSECILAGAEENLRRTNMNPLDTLWAYASALRHGATLSRVAASFGTSEAKVQRRVAIVERGDPDLHAAIKEEKVDLAQAATIVAAPASLRPLLLTRALEGLKAPGLRALASAAGIPTSSARFDLTPHEHLIERDLLFGLLPDRFTDLNAFFTLQREWCQAEVARMRELELEHNLEPLSQYTSFERPDLTRLGLELDQGGVEQNFVVNLNPLSGEVSILAVQKLGTDKNSSAGPQAARANQSLNAQSTPGKRAANGSAAGTDNLPARAQSGAGVATKATKPGAPPLPRSALTRTFTERTQALHAKLAQENRGAGLRRVMALTLIGLSDRNLGIGVVRHTASTPLGQTFTALPPGSALEQYHALCALGQAEFQALYTQMLAELVVESESLGLEGRALLGALEREVGLCDNAFFTLDSEYLSAFTIAELWEFAKELPLDAVVRKGQKKSMMVDALLKVAPALRAMNWMPTSFWPGGAPGTLSTPGVDTPREALERETETPSGVTATQADSVIPVQTTTTDPEHDDETQDPDFARTLFHLPEGHGGGGFPMVQARAR